MSAERIERARRNVERTRGRFESTLHALQARLHPKVLANEAWDGVRDKGGDLADEAMSAVKKRPVAVSAVAGALALFLVRNPLKRAVGRMVGAREDKHPDLVTTRLSEPERNYDAAATLWVEPAHKEGVS